MARQPGIPAWDAIWQEDGGIFLTDALNTSFLHAVFSPYNGYLHLVPRLIAEVVSAFPLDRAALLLAGASATVVSLLAVYVYWASGAVLRSQWARALLAVLFVLLPAAGYETNANISNLHWYLIFASFFAFLSPLQRRSEIVAALAVLIAAVMSDPMTALLVPVAAAQALRTRSWRRGGPVGPRIVHSVFVVLLALQLGLGTLGESPGRYAPSHWADVPGIYGVRVAASFLFGDRYLTRLYTAEGLLFAFGCLVVLVVVLGLGVAVARRTARSLAVVAVAYSAVFLVIPLMLRGTANFLDRTHFNLNGSRYVILPILFLYVAVLAVLDTVVAAPPAGAQGGTHPVRRWPLLPAAFTIVTAALLLTNYADTSVRTAGPSWHLGLADARQRCLQAHGLPAETRSSADNPFGLQTGPDQVAIPIAPNIPQQPFAVVVDCDRL